jgi:lysophospholipase L1-like esterase
MLTRASIVVLLALSRFAACADLRPIDTMDALSFAQPKEKATVEIVEGKDGKAQKFSFTKDCMNAFVYAKFKSSPDWDSAAGISFWVKGDGSDHLGGIQLIYDGDYSNRFGYAFRIDGTEWKKIVIPWSDFIPELCNENAKPLAKPSKISSFAFGKWWYWRDYAAHSYVIDDIRLESSIPAAPSFPAGPALARVAAKLKAGQPITVVTMGDSLTDFNHWANKPVNWPTLFKDSLKAKFKSEVTLLNPAIGGTELRQNVVMIPRWITKAPEPDLVTICFGYNDWHSGMRKEMFLQTMQDAIERVRRATNGKADVLVLSSCRALEKWDTFAELVEAAREAATAKNAGFANIFDAFQEAGKTEREKLFCSDKTHLGPRGHEVVAKTVLEVLEKAAQ